MKKHFEGLTFTEKMGYMVDVLGYSESDFEFYNQAYQLFDGLTPEQKLEAVKFTNGKE